MPARCCSVYLRHREALLACLLLAHSLLLRFHGVPTLLSLLPDGSGRGGGEGGGFAPLLRLLPWLARATGAESAALFALGFKASWLNDCAELHWQRATPANSDRRVPHVIEQSGPRAGSAPPSSPTHLSPCPPALRCAGCR